MTLGDVYECQVDGGIGLQELILYVNLEGILDEINT